MATCTGMDQSNLDNATSQARKPCLKSRKFKLANFALLQPEQLKFKSWNSEFFFCMGSETESVHFLPFKPCHWQYAAQASFVHGEPLSSQEITT